MTGGRDHEFQTTQWTIIVQSVGSSASARNALEELCHQYYRPVEFFIERWLRTRANSVSRNASLDAKDLTQAYFAKLLTGSQLAQANPMFGRFRSYLLASVKHFLIDQELQHISLKRGGGVSTKFLSESMTGTVSADAHNREGSLAVNLSHATTFPPEAFFDREWAIAIVERSIEEVRHEYLGTSSSPLEIERFQLLQSAIITPQIEEVSACRWAELQWSENAFRVALHRVRKRFRFFVQRRVAATLDDPSQIDTEIGYLIKAFSIGAVT